MYILPVYNIVYHIVREKESKMKETMRMMGLGDFAYWLSWLIHFTTINTVISVLAWVILCINVIKASNPFLILPLIWLYGQSLFAQIILVQSFITKSQYAGVAVTLVYFGSAILYVLIQHSEFTTVELNLALSAVPQVALH
jgi:hypothetical protein